MTLETWLPQHRNSSGSCGPGIWASMVPNPTFPPTGGPDFVRLGFRVEELDGNGVSLALAHLRKRRSLCVPDSFALAIDENQPTNAAVTAA